MSECELIRKNDLGRYPQVVTNETDLVNPEGCWDWWGYASPDKSEPRIE
jgi:hypothetical protein